MSLRIFTAQWLPAWFVLAVAAGWLAAPPFQPAPRKTSVPHPAPHSSLQQKSLAGAPPLAPELAGLTPSDQLAVIAAMAEAAGNASELTRLLEMIESLPPTIESNARHLLVLRWLDFDPVKACEVASYDSAILDLWAARDPLAVIEYGKHPDCHSYHEAWRAGLKHLVKNDPQAAWRLCWEAPEGWNDEVMAVDVTAAIAELNPADFTARLPREGMPGHRYFADVGAAKAWLLHDPVPGFRWIAHNPALTLGQDLIFMFEKVPLEAWPEAFKALHEVDAPRRDRLVYLISCALDNEHPRELIEMMDAAGIDLNAGRDGEWRADALASLAAKDPAGAAAMLSRVAPQHQPDAVSDIMVAWHKQSPADARAWAASLEEGEPKGAALKTIAFLERPVITESELTDEQKLLNQWRYIPHGAPVPREVLDDPGLLDRLAAAVGHIEGGSQRSEAGRKILYALMQGDSELILRALHTFPYGWPGSAERFFLSWHQLHPEAARKAAESLPEHLRFLALYALENK